MKMRVLQLMAGGEKGGAEKFFDRLVVGLHKKNIHQAVIVRPHPDRVAFLRKNGLTPIVAPFGSIFDFQTSHILRRTIATFNPDVVLTWMSRASKFCPKGPYVSVARLGGYYNLKYYQKADHLVGNTQDLCDYFTQQGWPLEFSHYLPNFVDAPSDSIAKDREALATPKEAKIILSLGRLHPNKGFDILIPALAKIPGAYLWLGGEGEEHKNLERLASKYQVTERVRFLGWCKDVSALYKAADVYVCPSRIEPLGNVVIEAWAHQKPVVAAESAGPKSLITHRENGLLVPIEDIDQLAAAIQEVLHHKTLRKKISQAGYQSYLNSFTEEKIIAQYINFFKYIQGLKRL
ncbi:MAG: glycosyl transferase [Caedibacter sp. 37-49]|nr:MAG: glycosyl transferase [Caedibacter sp. 37-49]